MTDRERLLEQVRWVEGEAERDGACVRVCILHPEWSDSTDLIIVNATRAAHHALTALALRDVMDYADRQLGPDGL